MKVFHIDSSEKFISVKLKDFCNKKSIKIKYVALYIYKENGIVERRWKTIVIIKYFLLVLLLNF